MDERVAVHFDAAFACGVWVEGSMIVSMDTRKAACACFCCVSCLAQDDLPFYPPNVAFRVESGEMESINGMTCTKYGERAGKN